MIITIIRNMKTEWKIMCANQQVCPDVKKNLEDAGFMFIKETPNSADSDLIMAIDINEKEITKKGEKVFEICGEKIQQISVQTN